MTTRIPSLAVGFLALIMLASGQSASASPGGCAAKNSKTIHHDGSLRIYSRREKFVAQGETSYRYPAYACSSKYGKRVMLLGCEYNDDCYAGSRWNGRYVYYTSESVGPTGSYGHEPRMIDLKTGRSDNNVAIPGLNGDVFAQCAQSHCEKWISRALIGGGRSFALGYSVRQFTGVTNLDLGFVVEKHCLSQDMRIDARVVLDNSLIASDLASIEIARGTLMWRSNGLAKSSRLCDG